jgi:hypothetical protein
LRSKMGLLGRDLLRIVLRLRGENYQSFDFRFF